MQPKVILASSSPRRIELIGRLGIPFTVREPQVDEDAYSRPDKRVHLDLALAKARDAAERYGIGQGLVIGADTVVVLDGALLNKPADREDARRMLKMLSGRTHTVWTSVAVLDAGTGRAHTFVEETEVTFHELTGDEIDWYLASGEYADKAGAYGVQERGTVLVEGIKGDFFNVMGLPVGRLWRVLREMGDFL